MGYSAVEAALAATIRQIDGLNSANVQAGSSQHILNHKASVRLTTGAVSRKASGLQSVTTVWTVHVDSFVQTTDETLDADRQEAQDMSAAMQNVVSVYPTLGSDGIAAPNAYVASEQILKVETAIPSEPTLERLGRNRFWVHRVDFLIYEHKIIMVDFESRNDTPDKVSSGRYRIRLPSEVFVSSEQPDDLRAGDLWIENDREQSNDNGES